MLPYPTGGDSILNHKPDSNIIPQSGKNSGGIFYGWIVLATGFLVVFIAFGFYYSFGIFFQDLQSEFSASRAEISLIASILTFTLNIMGLASGWATDKYGPRIVVGIGGILVCAGLILSSRTSAVWQLYVCLGIIMGCGISATLTPYVSILVKWFVKLRGLTQGILTASIGVGMMVMAPLSENLITSYGWRTSFVIIGIAGLVLFSISALLVRGNPQEKGLMPYGVTKHNKDVDAGYAATTPNKKDLSLGEAMKTKDLWLLCGVMLTLLLAIFMVATHLVNYAKDTGMSPSSAAILMTIVGATSTAGKVGIGSLADRIGSKTIIAACAAILAALMFWLSRPMTPWMLHVFAVIYGLAYGGSFPVINVLIAETFGITHMGKIVGFTTVGGAIGGVVGPWLAGYVFDTTASYSLAFLIAAGVSLVTIILILPVGKRHKTTAA